MKVFILEWVVRIIAACVMFASGLLLYYFFCCLGPVIWNLVPTSLEPNLANISGAIFLPLAVAGGGMIATTILAVMYLCLWAVHEPWLYTELFRKDTND